MALESAGEAERVVEALTACPKGELADAIASRLVRGVAQLWPGGWTPSDVSRFARRLVPPAARDLISTAVVVESRCYAALGDDVAPRWMAEVRDLSARPPCDDGSPWPAAWSTARGLSWFETVSAAVQSLGLLLRARALPSVMADPRSWRRGDAVAAASMQSNDKILQRVRSLLAKAESTDFEEEAEAFTAKAQELMARHRIDRHVVEVDANARPAIRAIRLDIDDPYAAAKAILLDHVARANGCRAVWSKGVGRSTVFGEDSDLELTELLFTSLLVQATRAMAVASTQRQWGKRAFRQSFLLGFDERIAHRLERGVAAAVAEAEAVHGRDILPVLARSDEYVDAAVDAAYPGLSPISVGARDLGGWRAGQLAGEVADLTAPRSVIES